LTSNKLVSFSRTLFHGVSKYVDKEFLFSTRFFMVGTESCKCKFVAVDTMKAYRSSKHMPSIIINLKIT
jgi:hypothetical protein